MENLKRMKKRERLALIKTMVTTHAIETQQELVQLLEQEGLVATQATVSRDVNEIGIVKVPDQQGRYIYGLPKEKKPAAEKTRESEIQSLKGFARLENCLHLDVVPGTSRLLKRLLLETFKPSIFSLIADDDSLFLMAISVEDAQNIERELQLWQDKA